MPIDTTQLISQGEDSLVVEVVVRHHGVELGRWYAGHGLRHRFADIQEANEVQTVRDEGQDHFVFTGRRAMLIRLWHGSAEFPSEIFNKEQ